MRRLAFVALFILSACSTVPVPDGFRMNKYKAPVPSYVPGGETISISEAVILKEKGAIFVDVIGSGKLLTPGIDDEWLVVRPHMSIPDSHWLPDVGRGALTTKQQAYFEQSLEALSDGDKTKPLVFFCLKSCWMSWNATKRAAAMGYQRLYWLPDGKDGWEAAGLPLKQVKPFSGGGVVSE
ncbi:PQQ-dependent catabolism-associated CXXCW motif protein [Terasakiella sp. A23]|uniref:rhodanese-like domain-containing protein n=1 Tax=Terasakiella sp. FCG-A23 TaxID=3080561 RepID=UPI002953C37E|nr:rhodanese-like domain-containing protein [Terasakiella sp. A23]MDV7339351.1 PQQ-dependent catabolism-associated CXXCW motif protein [Terasakiella sp. A23]